MIGRSPDMDDETMAWLLLMVSAVVALMGTPVGGV